MDILIVSLFFILSIGIIIGLDKYMGLNKSMREGIDPQTKNLIKGSGDSIKQLIQKANDNGKLAEFTKLLSNRIGAYVTNIKKMPPLSPSTNGPANITPLFLQKDDTIKDPDLSTSTYINTCTNIPIDEMIMFKCNDGGPECYKSNLSL